MGAAGIKLAHLPMHGVTRGGDSNSAMEDRSPDSAFGGSLALSGTVTNIWNNAGWYTPTTTSYGRAKTQAVVDLFDAQAAKAILLVADIYHAGDPSAECCLIDAGSNNSAAGNGGGMSLRMQTSGVLSMVMRDGATGASMNAGATKDVTADTATRINMAFLIDTEAFVLSSYYQGSYWTQASLTAGVMPKPPADWGACVGCRGATASTQDNFAGNGGNSLRLSNMWVVHDTSGLLLTEAAGVVADLYAAPAEIPRTLIRLTNS